MYAIFAQDLGLQLSQHPVSYKMYADDLKIYTEVRTDADKAALQKAINCVASWCALNRMEISTPKCAVLKTCPDDTMYYLNHVALPEVTEYRDLGVIFDSHMKFRGHITDTAKGASRMCNLILRTFISQDPSLYLKLYEATVVLKWTYYAHVWLPYLTRNINLLQPVHNKFVKRVANRCNSSRCNIPLSSVADYQDHVDRSVLNYLIRDDKVSQYFTVRPNNLRSGGTIQPPEIGHFDVVNNAFAWRVARKSRDCDILKWIIQPLFQ